MSLLFDAYNKALESGKEFGTKAKASDDVGYQTEIYPFDYGNGSVIDFIRADTGERVRYYQPGIVDGSFNQFIGRSGSGKTTIALQMAGAIARQFEQSMVVLISPERGSSYNRERSLLRFTDDQMRTKFRKMDQGITSESFLEAMEILYETKMAKADELRYDTGLVNIDGEKIYKLQPTIVILDSLAVLIPKDVKEQEGLASNMQFSASVKSNGYIYTKLMQMLKPANIILFAINHVMDNINIIPTKSQFAHLKQADRIPGGKKLGFVTDALLHFDDSTKLKEDKDFGINGCLMNIIYTKSRSGLSGRSVQVVFDPLNGVDTILSMFNILKESGHIQGNTHYYFKTLPDVKFTKKKFKEKLLGENPQLLQAFEQASMEALRDLIEKNRESQYNNRFTNFISNMGNNILASMNSKIDDNDIL